MAGEVVYRLSLSVKARNFNAFNKQESQKHAPRFKFRTWKINIASLDELAAKAESSLKVRSLFQGTSILVKYSQTLIYSLLQKTLNWGMWEIFWMLHNSSGPYGHTQLLTAALLVGIWSITVTGDFRECCQKGEGGCLCFLCEEIGGRHMVQECPRTAPLGELHK